MSTRIPRRIIQTGKQGGRSTFVRGVEANLRMLNPEFEYLFFDDTAVEDFIDEEFPQYRRVFDGFRFRIQRFDFFRYLVVYRLGGFYFDLDVLLAEPLSGLTGQGCVFPFEGLTLSDFLRQQCGMDWQIGNYAFGAEAGHPFLRAVIDNCIRAYDDPEWVKPMMRGFPILLRSESFVLNSTGPGLISRTFGDNPELAKTVTVLFPPGDVCDVTNWNHFGDLGVHLMAGSWRLSTMWLHRRLARFSQDWTFRKLMKESRALGKTRHHTSTTLPSTR